jgi:ATP-dependent Clp endopeptidase proteolytic subunit ClpP
MNLTALEAFQQSQTDRINQLRALTPKIRNEAPPVRLDGTTARIRLYQSIDDWGEFWGLSANELVDALDDLPSNIDTIELSINSPGGVVFEAVAIMNALRRHSAKVVAIVDGIAASAASFIAASADETWMMPNSTMMLHAPWGVAVGNATVMRELADVLDDLTLNIAEVYATKTGETPDEWLDRLAEGDLYYSAAEAVDAGLADGVLDLTNDDVDPDESGDDDTQTDDASASTGDDDTEAQARFDPSLSLALLDL